MGAFIETLPPAVWMALLMAGAPFLVRAGRLAWGARRFLLPPGDGVPELLGLMRAFRAFVVGASLVALGVGVALESVLVVAITLGIGLEELYESTMALSVLRRFERTEVRALSS